MTKILNNKYLLYAIFCVLLVGVVLTFSVRSMETASADYESNYLNNSQAMVNFNQYIQNTYINYTTSSYYSNSLPVGQYYMCINSNVNTRILFVYTGGAYYQKAISSGQNDFIINFNNEINAIQFDNAITYTNFNAINLTQMFGVGNEPNLQQCHDIFTADYYAYNTGSTIPFSGYEAYNLGVTDALNSYNNFAVNLSAISSAFIDNSLNNSNAFVTKFYEPSNTDYSYYLQARGYLSIPFNTTIDSGSLISFKYYDPGQGGSGLYLWCGVYYQNSFYPVMFIGDNTGETIQFASPVSTQYLMFADSSTRDTFTFSDSAYWLGDFVVDNAKFDMNALLDSARLNAYAEKDQYYLAYYGVNGTGYNSIYDSGYNTGINAQLSDAGRHFYTFPQFLGALFDVPVRTITSLLDFNVLGFNLKNFFFSLITLSIVFALIKFILVRTGDK